MLQPACICRNEKAIHRKYAWTGRLWAPIRDSELLVLTSDIEKLFRWAFCQIAPIRRNLVDQLVRNVGVMSAQTDVNFLRLCCSPDSGLASVTVPLGGQLTIGGVVRVKLGIGAMCSAFDMSLHVAVVIALRLPGFDLVFLYAVSCRAGSASAAMSFLDRR
jgi:hypothetical protein